MSGNGIADSVLNKGITRRGFIGAVGLSAAALALSGMGVISKEAAAAQATSTTSCDVLIVGAGGAGMAAASQAAGFGANTIVLEKGEIQQGSSVLALGTFYGAGTQIQKAAGIEDNPDSLYDYFLTRGGDKLDESVQRLCANEFGRTIDWLSKALNVPFTDKVSLKGTDTVPRGHNCANTADDALVATTDYATQQGAQVVYQTAAKSLIMDNGAVVGVLATGPDGSDVEYDAKKTIMACGGFARNDEMVAKYMPDYAGIYTEVGAGCTGEGLQMGLDQGAAYIGHGGVNGILYCAVQTGQSKLIAANSMWVASDGKRFNREDGQTHDIFYQVAKFDDRTFYAVYDQAMVDALDDKLKEKFQSGLDSGLFTQGDTVADAASAQGLDGATVEATLESYNQMCEAGEDTEFGKDPKNLVAITQAPFYVLKMGVATHGTFGGYTVNDQLEVLDENGDVIPNFYAVGECSCGTFIYDDYPAGGCGLNWSYTSGRLAGAHAAGQDGSEVLPPIPEPAEAASSQADAKTEAAPAAKAASSATDGETGGAADAKAGAPAASAAADSKVADASSVTDKATASK